MPSGEADGVIALILVLVIMTLVFLVFWAACVVGGRSDGPWND